MKLIFLDIDGVLNCGESISEYKTSSKLWPTSIRALSSIIEVTGARVVISSTWRIDFTLDELRTILWDSGVWAILMGATPFLTTKLPDGTVRHEPRGLEIQHFLDNKDFSYWGGVESFVILDDDSDMVHLADRLVQTNFETGLTDDHVDEAIRILNTPL